jgi:hypothetical protein
VFVRYDLCERAVARLRWELFRINGAVEDTLDEREQHLVEVVMQTRPGLDRQKVAQMVEALWECEG